MIRLLVLLLLSASINVAVAEVRIKDIAAVQGVRDNQLVGYGVVVGLQGTGDSLRNAPFTEQALQSMLDRMGVNTRGGSLRTRNVAAVVVTADIPPFIGKGARLDVTVSSIGDAQSLAGGTLVMTTLQGGDGKTYAVAQGAIAGSGFSAAGQAESVSQGIPTVGRVPNGALVEREPPAPVSEHNELMLELRNPDFATAIRIVDAINGWSRARHHMESARERSMRTVALTKPAKLSAARFFAEIGDLLVEPDSPARVVIDARTGTVVIGQDVRISTVAVTHGSISLRITETPQVSQPAPLSGGKTVVTPQTSIEAREASGQVAVLGGASLRGLVRGLNQIGVKPSGIIAIIQAIKSSGALHADLVIQ